MIDPATAIAVCRFLHDGALLLLWGSAAFLAFLTPQDLTLRTWSRLTIVPMLGAAVIALTALASLPLQTAAIGEGWADATNLETIRAVLLESSVGVAWQAQFATATLLLLAFATPSKRRIAFVAFGSALSISALTLNGHASIHQGWLAVAHRFNDIIHMLAAGAWLGALIPLIIMLRQLAVDNHQASAQTALRRFSTAGHIAVALVLFSGTINTLLILGTLPTDWQSPYQRLLIVKIAAVCIMIGLATANRYCFVPAMAENGPRAVRLIRIGSVLEVAIGLGVVALVSVFGMLDPV